VNLPLILAAGIVAAASPGPATLTIAGTSLSSGRSKGLALAAGISSGSLIWSIAAATGLAAAMYAHAWVFDLIRYLGAVYLLYLGWKSARAACYPEKTEFKAFSGSRLQLYVKGLILHLLNPKAVLFFGSLFSIGIPTTAPIAELWIVVAAVGFQSSLIFHGYAIVFSHAWISNAYIGLRRWFEGAFALAFSYAGLRMLTARLP
jgi:threonine/homoserine/homoserine lactone efflux protein